MPRTYETVLIFDPSLTDEQVDERIDRYKDVLAAGEDAFHLDLWGKRKLSYPIQKKEQGIYAVLRYDTEPDSLNELERIARLDEMVLRHLTVVNPPGAAGKEEETGSESR